MKRTLTRALVTTVLMTMACVAQTARAEDNTGFLSLPPEGPYVPAVRLSPPPVPDGPPAFDGADIGPDGRAGRCVGAEPLLAYYSPGWDVVRMSHFMHGESGCNPGAYNRRGQAAGLLQITPVNHRFLSDRLGFQVTTQALFDPVVNIRAAAELWKYSGYRPWAL